MENLKSQFPGMEEGIFQGSLEVRSFSWAISKSSDEH